MSGGGGEIRTHERLPVAGFQDQCNRPLCHASVLISSATTKKGVTKRLITRLLLQYKQPGKMP